MAATGTATLDSNGERIVVGGDWTLENLVDLSTRAARLKRGGPTGVAIEGSGLRRVDTAGAHLLLELAGGDPARIDGLPAAAARLLSAVAATQATPAVLTPRPDRFSDRIVRIGSALETFWRDSIALVAFIGLVLSSGLRVILMPRRWRITSTFFHIEQTGFNALPIVALLCFLVGAVVAFLGATVLKEFGASVYTVELVGYSFLREFGVLLTAIMVAGRSGSAFTAQIGSMKAREEIDAIRTLGLEPVDVLVMPRVFALLVSMPILTLVGMLAGILGGAAVCALALDISPQMFITRLHETTSVRHFWVGMSKAPIFAFLIAAIGCLEGFKVSGSAESVGAHTTSSVVQSIFVVILVDAIAAIFFMEVNL